MSNKDRKDTGLSLDEIEEMEQEEIENAEKEKKREKFNIFSRILNRDGKGVEKDEVRIADDPSFANFFKLIGRKLNQLLSINILFIFGNFPIFFILLAITGYFSVHTSAPAYSLYPILSGVMKFAPSSPGLQALFAVFSRRQNITVFSTVDWILFGIGLLVVFTYGPVRVGITYLLRNMFRGEPIFFFHDFWYAVKRNLRQAIIYGVIDVLIVGLIIWDIIFFNLNYGANMMMSIMFFMSLALAVLYYMMRHYIYLMLVTFDLSIFKMFKNALYFTVLWIKLNIMLILGTIVLAALEILLMMVYVPLAVIIPFVILPSLVMMMGVYAAYPKIKEIMIDPYYEEQPEEDPPEDLLPDETLSEDGGTATE